LHGFLLYFYWTMSGHHEHDHHHHHHSVDISNVSRALVMGIILNLTFVAVEFGAGFISDSLALLSDAGHNLSDVAGLALSLVAFRLLKFKPTQKFTYGYRKASILASLLNAVILLIAVGSIGFESIQRFLSPRQVQSETIIWVAAIGIAINTLSALLFFRNKEKDLNIKGAYLHLMIDALVSLGVVGAGIIISYTQWLWVDPLISVIIMIIIVTSTWNLLKVSFQLTIDAVPAEIQMDKIRSTALQIPGVTGIHHIHVWAISTAENALTAHIIVDEKISQQEISRIKNKFKHDLEHLGIRHATLETEIVNCSDEKC